MSMPPLELPQWLASLARASEWGRDPAALTDARSRFVQSGKGAVARVGVAAFASALDGLRPALEQPSPLLPGVEEIRTHILPPQLAARCNADLTMIHLGFGQPTVDANAVSLSIVFHLRRNDERLKVKVALFEHVGRFYWELGAVDPAKSIHQPRDASELADVASTGNWHTLTSRLIDNVQALAANRDGLAGLDITPAYYHVLGVALRNGGRAEPAVDFSQWRQEFESALDRAFAHWLSAGNERYQTASRRDRRLLKSWLLWKGALADPATGGRLAWRPPRLTIAV
jgi:hypothetical protein